MLGLLQEHLICVLRAVRRRGVPSSGKTACLSLLQPRSAQRNGAVRRDAGKSGQLQKAGWLGGQWTSQAGGDGKKALDSGGTG